MAFSTQDLVAYASRGLFKTSATGTPVIVSISPVSGRFGTYVEVTGTNFGTSGACLIGDVPLKIIEHTATKIRGTVQAGLGAGDKTVLVYNQGTGLVGTYSSFTVDSPAEKTARTKIRQAIKYGLETISTAGGFRTTLHHVYDPPKSIEQMKEFPCANLLWGNELRSDEHLAGSDSLLDLGFVCEIDVFLREQGDPSTEQDKALADVMEYFGHNFYIPDSSGERTAFNCIYEGSTPWGIDSQKPLCGITVRLQVWYRTNLTNPDSLS